MFKLIKSSDWTTNTGRKGTTLTLAFKGRVFVVNKEDFEKIEIKKDVVTLNEPFEMVVEEYNTPTGPKKGLRLKPKLDFDIAIC